MDIEKEFEQRLPLIKRLEEEALFILANEVKSQRIKIHSLLSRIKSFDSFFNKAQRKEFDDPFSQIKDLLGLRVVTLLRSDLENVANIIRNNFIVISEDNIIDGREMSSFGYMSNHFIVKLENALSGPRYKDLHDHVFEIQSRTIAMDAWATISHYLDYKSDHDVPSELRKDFYALSGLFYVADTHFEIFYKERLKSKSMAIKLFKSKKVFSDLELNLDNFSAYIRSKFKNRQNATLGSLSKLIDELHEVGYRKIGEIDKLIDAGMPAFIKYERENPPGPPGPGTKHSKFYDIGVIRILFEIMDDEYLQARQEKDGRKDGERYVAYRKYAKKH